LDNNNIQWILYISKFLNIFLPIIFISKKKQLIFLILTIVNEESLKIADDKRNNSIIALIVSTCFYLVVFIILVFTQKCGTSGNSDDHNNSYVDKYNHNSQLKNNNEIKLEDKKVEEMISQKEGLLDNEEQK